MVDMIMANQIEEPKDLHGFPSQRIIYVRKASE